MEFKTVIGGWRWVCCKNRSELEFFLSYLEKENYHNQGNNNPITKWLDGYRDDKFAYIKVFYDKSILYNEYYNMDVEYIKKRHPCVDFSKIDDFKKDFVNFRQNVKRKHFIIETKRKGKKVIAILRDPNYNFIKLAFAKCHPEDNFDFEVGKKIALQRLFEIEPQNKKEIVKREMRLKNGSSSYGIVGETTKVKAYGNINLYVGDVVEVFYNGVSMGLKCICKDSFSPKGYVSGIGRYGFENGGVEGDYLVIKRKSYKEMLAGDVVDCKEYVLKERRV